MVELSIYSDGDPAEEAQQPEPDSEEQEVGKGKAVLGSTELMREELIQSAVSFLKHPKVIASSDVQRRSFLENKGLTVDEINEAFQRLQSPSSNYVSSNTCTSQGVSNLSCRITQQETKVGTKCLDDAERVEHGTEPVAPVVPPHPKSYMEVMEMIQRGERPDDIQDIKDDPPNPDQPISEPRMAPKPKPWEKQDQDNSTRDLKSLSSHSSEVRSELQNATSKATESDNSSSQGDSLLQAEAVVDSESHIDDAASSK